MAELVCKLCGNHVGLWGGFNGTTKTYYKHQVSRKLLWPHEPEPITQSEYDMYYRRGQEYRNRKMLRIQK